MLEECDVVQQALLLSLMLPINKRFVKALSYLKG